MIRKSNLKIIIKLWIFVAIIAGSTQQSFAKCAEISPTRPGEVYFLRGLANIFSLGLDVMAKKVTADGVENCVFNHHHWKALANDIIERNYQKQISLPIVIVGHSLGANVAPQLATNLGRHGIPVSYVVMLDPVEAERIGVNVKEKFPEKTVLYISAEKFTQQYIDSVKKNNRNDFIHFYQIIDVLIIDDVQFFSGKTGTQDVFFHIFNHLHQNGKQVILTSDKAPVDMQDIEQRLLSRFKWGLSAELQRPDYETRVSILKNKLYRDGLEISDEVIDYVAKNVKVNVRELEGAVISLIAQSSFNKKEITIELAKSVVEKFVKNTKREVSIDYIQKIVSEYFQMDVSTLQSKTRKRHIVQARQLAMFFAKKFTKASLASIGSQIGHRDHATVLHACKTVDNLSFTDKQFRKYVEDLSKKFTV